MELSDSDVYRDHYYSEILILFNVIAASNALMVYVIVVYPLKKSKLFSSTNDSNAVSRTISESRRQKENQRMTLSQILQNHFGYDAFIQHLSGEFSMENLLSLTEFLQWKLYIHERCRDSTMNKKLKYWLTMLPLKNLPRSKIVYSGGAQSA